MGTISKKVKEEKIEAVIEGVREGITIRKIAEGRPDLFKDRTAVQNFIKGTLSKDEAYKEYQEIIMSRRRKRRENVEMKKEIVRRGTEQRITMKQIAEGSSDLFKDRMAVQNFIRGTLKNDEEYNDIKKNMQRKKEEDDEKKKNIIIEGAREGQTPQDIARDNSQFFKDSKEVNKFINSVLKKDPKAFDIYLNYGKLRRIKKRIEDVRDELEQDVQAEQTEVSNQTK